MEYTGCRVGHALQAVPLEDFVQAVMRCQCCMLRDVLCVVTAVCCPACNLLPLLVSAAHAVCSCAVRHAPAAGENTRLPPSK